ncbi:5-formyltetrahydrofolate cyclo-ligase [Aeropyrum camini]|uniref:5-formyltetrahydrofolate cyclo-ligase n=1 Tax=Aeropyrum camini SY1 = JCM 12091 TaxID=1198449 RepID=U3TCB9_9CREN|nr:5-formyltetrahydrofolate cyclo-ligase [Aeropyrum camini]BAN89593.1 5-formyltetrahydrofolate cyclo-ligase [Aeropyrum camini SY1 = JCM 12091]
MESGDDKQAIRERIWRLLEETGAALPPGAWGRIPNFKGAREAALRLFSLDEWRNATFIKVNPDSPQRWVRLRALEEGKLLLMPTPRLRRGFLLIDPSAIPRSLYRLASTIRGAFRAGRLLKTVSDLTRHVERIDLVVEGSVAVNRWGERLGKGEGYGDLEFAILLETSLLDREAPIATTVHDLQVLPHRLPQDDHDVPVDIISTPTRLIRAAERPPRPAGLLPDRITPEKLREIPILSEVLQLYKR